MRRRGAPFALLQEPYFVDGGIRGLPAGMRVFANLAGNSAVVVDDRDVDCTVVSRARWGVCISVEGVFGRMLLASLYCAYGGRLDPYIRYMDSVLLQGSNIPTILGLDANACSSMWFSKMPRNVTGHPNYNRGVVLGDWLVTVGVSVLNEASPLYTFAGPNGRSDIDLTIANNLASSRFDFRWRVRDNGGISDHNLIEIVVAYRPIAGWTGRLRGWRGRDIDWGVYQSGLGRLH
ncbi:Putative 115 kDa protein in type-1 retrotransposable element R1DM [Eumeta japonica]|uniref:115 kDa protein in type-1 retrotransposable element R1DM n=1 Tax=Eumeta variegata TaxID=151549 RepID=A0A4C1ZY07_EUMVA|nr:Putative 115 kDa protein in type-1 retrotransposable element R1DM [Eumeta japonica]